MLMRQIGQSGIKKRAFCYLQRRTQWQSRNLFRGRTTTCSRRSKDSKSRTRGTNGSTKNQWQWVRWKQITRCCMVWEAAFSIGSIWEEPAKASKKQREETWHRARISEVARTDPTMALTKAWTTSSSASSPSSEDSLVWAAKSKAECLLSPYQQAEIHPRQVQLQPSHSQAPP